MRDHRRFGELAVGRLVDPHHLEFPLPDYHRAAHPGAPGEELGLHRRREQHDGSTVLDVAGAEVLAVLEPHLVDLRSLGRNTVNLREGVAGVGEQGRPLFHDRAHHRHVRDVPDRLGVARRQRVRAAETGRDVHRVAAPDVVAGPHDDDVGPGGTHIVGDGRPGAGAERGHGDDRGDADHQADQGERGPQRIRGEGGAGGAERERGFHGMRSLRAATVSAGVLPKAARISKQ